MSSKTKQSGGFLGRLRLQSFTKHQKPQAIIPILSGRLDSKITAQILASRAPTTPTHYKKYPHTKRPAKKQGTLFSVNFFPPHPPPIRPTAKSLPHTNPSARHIALPSHGDQLPELSPPARTAYNGGKTVVWLVAPLFFAHTPP